MELNPGQINSRMDRKYESFTSLGSKKQIPTQTHFNISLCYSYGQRLLSSKEVMNSVQSKANIYKYTQRRQVHTTRQVDSIQTAEMEASVRVDSRHSLCVELRIIETKDKDCYLFSAKGSTSL
jgi:hypothetical protein